MLCCVVLCGGVVASWDDEYSFTCCLPNEQLVAMISFYTRLLTSCMPPACECVSGRVLGEPSGRALLQCLVHVLWTRRIAHSCA